MLAVLSGLSGCTRMARPRIWLARIEVRTQMLLGQGKTSRSAGLPGEVELSVSVIIQFEIA